MIKKFLKAIPYLNCKTIWFNFHYLPFKQAIWLPIFISRRVRLLKTKGSIEILGNIEPGMIKIGYGFVGIFDKKNTKTLFELTGKIIFRGTASIWHSSRTSVSGILDLGNNFQMSAASIVATKMVKIGYDCMVSWEILILDTDFHKIYFEDKIVNEPKAIIIGDRCWLGCRTTILKGAVIHDNTIIGAGSIVSRDLKEGNCIYAGSPAVLVKKGTRWDY